MENNLDEIEWARRLYGLHPQQLPPQSMTNNSHHVYNADVMYLITQGTQNQLLQTEQASSQRPQYRITISNTHSGSPIPQSRHEHRSSSVAPVPETVYKHHAHFASPSPAPETIQQLLSHAITPVPETIYEQLSRAVAPIPENVQERPSHSITLIPEIRYEHRSDFVAQTPNNVSNVKSRKSSSTKRKRETEHPSKDSSDPEIKKQIKEAEKFVTKAIARQKRKESDNEYLARLKACRAAALAQDKTAFRQDEPSPSAPKKIRTQNGSVIYGLNQHPPVYQNHVESPQRQTQDYGLVDSLNQYPPVYGSHMQSFPGLGQAEMLDAGREVYKTKTYAGAEDVLRRQLGIPQDETIFDKKTGEFHRLLAIDHSKMSDAEFAMQLQDAATFVEQNFDVTSMVAEIKDQVDKLWEAGLVRYRTGDDTGVDNELVADRNALTVAAISSRMNNSMENLDDKNKSIALNRDLVDLDDHKSSPSQGTSSPHTSASNGPTEDTDVSQTPEPVRDGNVEDISNGTDLYEGEDFLEGIDNDSLFNFKGDGASDTGNNTFVRAAEGIDDETLANANLGGAPDIVSNLSMEEMFELYINSEA